MASFTLSRDYDKYERLLDALMQHSGVEQDLSVALSNSVRPPITFELCSDAGQNFV
ncbi:hypothetical protein [Microbacterium sp. K24]|uniref:hypothetical protein n=1 Tax=Microbacterium sp. K24 TaxID=2305446 RepID=UPI0014447711|nr:hypothetical protein [Microbacterium sp. K24]